jgi:hypothetical protein
MKNEALKLALEFIEANHFGGPDAFELITAIKQALALDKMAENARELGLDYEPAPVQEPVAWRTFDGEGGYDYRTYDMNEDYAKEWNERNPNHKGWVEPLYTTPPEQPEPVQEPVGVFVEDDDIGHVRLNPHLQLKLKDGDKLYTTPPTAQPAPVQERTDYAVHLNHCNIGECEGVCKYLDDDCPALKHADMKAKWDRPTPPAAQRQWVGLTGEEILIMSQYDLEYAALIGKVERKLKEKNK